MERAYKSRGIYAPSIRACLEYFSPDQMIILDSNEFFKVTCFDPEGCI